MAGDRIVPNRDQSLGTPLLGEFQTPYSFSQGMVGEGYNLSRSLLGPHPDGPSGVTANYPESPTLDLTFPLADQRLLGDDEVPNARRGSYDYGPLHSIGGKTLRASAQACDRSIEHGLRGRRTNIASSSSACATKNS